MLSYIIIMTVYCPLPFPCMFLTHSYIQAYKQGLRYPKQQFLIIGWYGDGWWIEPESERKLDCTPEEIAKTLDYTLGTLAADFYTNESLVTEGGLVSVVVWDSEGVINVHKDSYLCLPCPYRQLLSMWHNIGSISTAHSMLVFQ